MKFVDAESVVAGYLRPLLSPVRVLTKVPHPAPASLVRVWRTGGAAANRVLDRPMVTVQAWGPDAWELAARCRDAILSGSAAMHLVRGVEEVTGPYFDPDPGSGTDRVTFTVQFQMRATR